MSSKSEDWRASESANEAPISSGEPSAATPGQLSWETLEKLATGEGITAEGLLRQSGLESVIARMKAHEERSSERSASLRPSRPWIPTSAMWIGEANLIRQFEDELARTTDGVRYADDLAPRISIIPSASPLEPIADLTALNSQSSAGADSLPGNHNRDWPSLYALSLVSRFSTVGPVPEVAFRNNYAVLMEAVSSLAATVPSGSKRYDLQPWAMLPKDRDRLANDSIHERSRARALTLMIGTKGPKARGPLFSWGVLSSQATKDGTLLVVTGAGERLLERLTGLSAALPHSSSMADAFFEVLSGSPLAVGDLEGFLLLLWLLDRGLKLPDVGPSVPWRDIAAVTYDVAFPARRDAKPRREASLDSHQKRSRPVTRGHVAFQAYMARSREWGLITAVDRHDRYTPPSLTELGATVLRSHVAPSNREERFRALMASEAFLTNLT